MTARRKEASGPALPAAGLRQAAGLAMLMLLALGAIGAWHWHGALDPVAIAAEIGRYPAAPAVFVAAQIAASLLFVPRALLAIAAGLLFGIGWGILWAAVGSLAGAIAGFLLARGIGAGLFGRNRGRRLRALLVQFERGGWRAVAALRLVPVLPHSLTNYGLGLTRLRLAPYAAGSLLGQLPMTVAYVDLGGAGSRLMRGQPGWLVPTAIGAGLLAVSLLMPAVAGRRGRAAPVKARARG